MSSDFQTRHAKAVASNSYIHVFKKDGKFRTGTLKITGAEKMFEKNPNFVYSSELRHCGVRSDLEEYLSSYCGFSNYEAYLKNAYCVTCSSSLKKAMNDEITAILNSPSKKVLSKNEISVDYISKIASAMSHTKKLKPATPSPMSPKSAPKKVNKTFKERIAELPEGKVLDLSGFNVEKNRGIKVTGHSSRSTKRRLANTGDLNRVIFDFTKDKSIAVSALRSLGVNEEKATNIVNAGEKAANATLDISKIISPKRKTN